MKSLPLILTLFRMAMGPVIAGLVLWAAAIIHRDPLLAGFIYALCLILFVLAALSDWLDGAIARKYDAVSPLGAALDHTADKVLIVCVLAALAYAALPLELVATGIVILGRDAAMAGLREGLGAQNKAIAVGPLGKWKAAAVMAGVGAFLAFQAGALLFASESWVSGLYWAARILLWAGAALALASAALYARALVRKTA